MTDSQVPSRWLAYGLLCATTLFWGGNFVLGRAVSADIPPVALAWWRWVLALLVILPFAARPLWQLRPVLVREWRYLLAVSILSVTIFNTFVYLGLQTLPATNAVLLLSSGPVLILLFTWLLFGEAMSVRQLLGTAVSIAGVILIVTEGQPTELFSAFRGGSGNLWILAAVISWCLYSVLLRRRPAEIGGTAFFALTALVGWIVLTPLFLHEHFVQDRVMDWNTTTLLSIGYVGLFASVVAFLFWNRGVQILGPGSAGYFINLIPVWALLLATLLLGERLLPFHWVGMVFIFSGIALATLIRKSPKPVTP
ncbi:MAG: DMT family transporter [Natronospirillum sp.]|uniref:DMT family transporter n=1 Tax=Natronospirillum sp. TaxID=2812955 RepID=UPI0025D28099|nr:DMT family transporter [Natronospirillum sp.]MCH8551753.1 DMT family transporter [Natronospirillum sp.]